MHKIVCYDKPIKTKEVSLMDKLIFTARKIDVVFKIADVMLKIALVTCIVCLGIIAVGVIFDLPADMIATNYDQVEIGPLNFHIAEGFVPEFDGQLGQAAIMLAMGAAASFIGILCVKTIRDMLNPMKEGQPFHSSISKNLRKLGWLSLILGVVVNVMEAVSLFSVAAMQHIDALLISEKITQVDVNASFDVSFLIIPAVLFLLAYIFRYGEELQTLSDETL